MPSTTSPFTAEALVPARVGSSADSQPPALSSSEALPVAGKSTFSQGRRSLPRRQTSSTVLIRVVDKPARECPGCISAACVLKVPSPGGWSVELDGGELITPTQPSVTRGFTAPRGGADRLRGGSGKHGERRHELSTVTVPELLRQVVDHKSPKNERAGIIGYTVSGWTLSSGYV